ncbi:lipopolysaccharide assembly protein LapA domain-containing protein [Pseudomonas sp. CCC3.2]|uniref:lipopolysaccharide assembly protein LapA domain-containing protein n=1 Tax=unclassified Pseudomonas TaxID=196821 RepID=UPI002AB57D8B|nr:MULTISPECIES: lipopolysaccharide assembly protein LapA domain-containing protein [unclassified Pseudomonas]MDY7561406.1 lipopolysaccharide assembly protein LapA domain-containing protein [Pseudomonas sp. AB6]MEB0178938.1 lipopolysaccharide assembly protein LapA domain-containing protein [Pseudomonas sp. CCC3.2]MEB0210202.1 lipopolysaccharide assembly protein LapA domain-containing protein [Pseudomonas sp. AB6]
MRNLMRIILVTVILLIALATVVFLLENQQPIALAFLGWTGPQMSVAVPVILALLVGMVIGPVLGWGLRVRKIRKASRSA